MKRGLYKVTTHSAFPECSLPSKDMSTSIAVKGCGYVKRKSFQLQWFEAVQSSGKIKDARVSPSFASYLVTLGKISSLSILVFAENSHEWLWS